LVKKSHKNLFCGKNPPPTQGPPLNLSCEAPVFDESRRPLRLGETKLKGSKKR